MNISTNVDDILYYSGRILSGQKLQGIPELCESVLDLRNTTFCVPLMDSYSPMAISMVLEIHWYDPDAAHEGVESLHRQVQKTAHIISGINLLLMIKEGCWKYRILNKQSIEMAMGAVQDVNLCISPAFYTTQVDICGSFDSFLMLTKGQNKTLANSFLLQCNWCCGH